MQASRAFYARFGLDFGDEGDPLWDQHHVSAPAQRRHPASTSTSTAPRSSPKWDTRVARRYRRRPRLQGRHDATRSTPWLATLAADGVPVQQPPCDAFWGARYAIVSDPDGNAVGIMSPVDPDRSRSPTPRSTVTDSGRRRASRWSSRSPRGAATSTSTTTSEHVIRLDRRLFTATTYPADYGFVPDTLAGDGDPLDALALVADPTFPGCVVRVRILGMFSMRDEKGVDAKLICVLSTTRSGTTPATSRTSPSTCATRSRTSSASTRTSNRRSRPRWRVLRTGPRRWPSSRPCRAVAIGPSRALQ